MATLNKIEHEILATGRVDGHHVEQLRKLLYVNGRIDRAHADFLAVLYKRVQHHSPAFDRFFFHAVKDHVMMGGLIGAEATAWLRRLLFADGTIRDEERKFLQDLKGEATQACDAFQELCADAMRQPQEQHTCG